MIKIKWAKLHTTLLLSGTNLQDTLDMHKRDGLEMLYDRAAGELLVTFDNGQKKESAIIPVTNIAVMIEGEVEKKPKVEPVKPITRATAQVETPQSHVFAGAGHGKTGK